MENNYKYLTEEEQLDIDLKILKQEELEARIQLEDRTKILVTMMIITLIPSAVIVIMLMIKFISALF